LVYANGNGEDEPLGGVHGVTTDTVRAMRACGVMLYGTTYPTNAWRHGGYSEGEESMWGDVAWHNVSHLFWGVWVHLELVHSFMIRRLHGEWRMCAVNRWRIASLPLGSELARVTLGVCNVSAFGCRLRETLDSGSWFIRQVLECT
jgi:hypothetical protein